MPAGPLWILSLVGTAAGSCPALYLRSLLTVGLLALAAFAAARRGTRAGALLWIVGGAFAAAAWWLRDRNLLLGDSRVWIQNADFLRGHLPGYRSPLAAVVLGWVARPASGTGAVAAALAMVSVASGWLTAVLLAGALRREAPDRSAGAAALALVLVFAAPVSFVFYGHVEVYPLFAAVFAAFLASLLRDFARGRTGVGTAALLAAACLVHVAGLLAAVPLAAWALSPRRGRRMAAVWAGLMAAGWGATALLPPLRAHSLAAHWEELHPPGDYLWDVAGDWLLVLIPAGLVALAARRRALDDAPGRILGLTTAGFLLFPLIGRFELGGYRDLDLMTPALVSAAFFAGRAAVRSGFAFRPALLAAIAPGPILLGGLLTLTLCPAGAKFLAAQNARGSVTGPARSYGWEILAYYHRERGEAAAGEADVRKALEATPGNHRLWGTLGDFQLARGDTSGAVSSLARSMDSPRAGRTAGELGELLTASGRAGEAVSILEAHRAATLSTGRGAAALAVAWFRLDRPESTLAVARARLRLDPGDDVAHFNAAAALSALRLPGAALAELREAARLDPGALRYHRQILALLLSGPDGRARAGDYLRSLPPALRDSVLAPAGP